MPNALERLQIDPSCYVTREITHFVNCCYSGFPRNPTEPIVKTSLANIGCFLRDDEADIPPQKYASYIKTILRSSDSSFYLRLDFLYWLVAIYFR